MASIDKISASLFSARNENTLALASLNFDFSLFKVAAPPEYMDVGSALTRRRQHDAESGPAHQTARKLGALFESATPPTPLLISTYGKRASKIMQTPGVNPSGSTLKHGPFADLIGVDATSIWAAATSGTHSIAIYLLACLLARAFEDPSVATSVWVEMIAERQREVREVANGGNFTMAQFAAIKAADQNFSREELRQWDASVRAWLQAADGAMAREHAQFQLIIKNISLPVSGGTWLYSDVKNAWIDAMTGLERLLAGEALAVSNGSVLLAMSSWHLYPSLTVLASQVKTIKTTDALMKTAGIVTVGIMKGDTTEDGHDGIYWSLALSHYRFYGKPVEVVGTAEDRLSMEELHLVALGSLFKSWGVDRHSPEPAVRWIISLWKCIDRVKPLLPRPQWLRLLVTASENLIDSSDAHKKHCRELFNFGQRRGTKFLGLQPGSATLPWFGLRSPQIINSLCKANAAESAIHYLRELCSYGRLEPDDALITVAVSTSKGYMTHTYASAVARPEMIERPIELRDTPDSPESLDCEEVNKGQKTSGKAVKIDNDCIEKVLVHKHSRWSAEYRIEDGVRQPRQTPRVHVPRMNEWELIHELIRDTEIKESDIGIGDGVGDFDIDVGSNFAFMDPELRKMGESEYELFTPLKDLSLGSAFAFSAKSPDTLIAPALAVIERGLKGVSDSTLTYQGRFVSEQDFFKLWFTNSHGNKVEEFLQRVKGLRLGEPNSLMSLNSSLERLNSLVDPLLLWQYFEGPDPYDPADFVKPVLSLMDPERQSCEEVIKPLKNLAFASSIYDQLEGATISSKIVDTGLVNPKWGHKDAYLTPTRSDIFSCIAMMETGVVDLKPEGMEKVLGLSSGNSLFVLSQLLSDPGAQISKTAVTRLIGNVGRPGLSLLVLPAAPPLVRQLSTSYRAVAYAPFDGKWEDNFGGTSLHLSLTKHEFPIDYGAPGVIDHQVFLVECVVSVHDGQEWVTDLDLLEAFDNNHIPTLSSPTKRCNGSCAQSRPALVEEISKAVTSIDSWEEVIDCPPSLAFIRARNNWAARLAIATVLAQGGGDSVEEEIDKLRDGGKRGRDIFAVLEPSSGGKEACYICVYRRVKQRMKQSNQRSLFYLII